MSYSYLGLEWTCVGIPKGSILGYFGMFYEIQFYSYAFNHELTVFDRLIDAPMWNYCEIDMRVKSSFI